MDFEAVQQYLDSTLSVRAACDRLGVSRSTFFRWVRVLRPSLARPEDRLDTLRVWVVQRYRQAYADRLVSVREFFELERDHFEARVSYSTVVRWLERAGVGRDPRARQTRKRMPGELVHVAVWPPGTHPAPGAQALLLAVDDASRELVAASWCDPEDTAAWLDLLQSCFREHGLPMALRLHGFAGVDAAGLREVLRRLGVERRRAPRRYAAALLAAGAGTERELAAGAPLETLVSRARADAPASQWMAVSAEQLAACFASAHTPAPTGFTAQESGAS